MKLSAYFVTYNLSRKDTTFFIKHKKFNIARFFYFRYFSAAFGCWLVRKFNKIKTTLSKNDRTHNWRFGASGDVAPRKVHWEYERLCPA